MQYRNAALLPVGAAAAFAALGVFCSTPAAVQAAAPAPAVASVTIPAAPQVPATPAFADEVAGRHLLFAAREAYRNAAAVRFTANWRAAVLSPNPGRPAVVVSSGAETVSTQPSQLRLNLTSETRNGTTGNTKTTVRRATADGSTLIATHSEEEMRKGASVQKPTREFVRLPLAEVDDLSDALTLVQLTPVTRGAQMLFAPEWNIRGVAWRVPGLPATVVEAERVRGNDRNRTTITRRYKLDPKTHLLLSFEEWIITEERGTPANRRPRVLYRREDYALPNTRSNGTLAPAGQAITKGYVEVALPGSEADLPPTHTPSESDPKALALLHRWEAAQARLLTYSAHVRLTAEAKNKTNDGRPLPEAWQRMNALYNVSLRRPGQVLISVVPNSQFPLGNFLRPVVAASDGETVSLLETWQPGRPLRSVALGDNPDALPNRLRQVGFVDGAQALTWLLERPWSLYENADTAVYRGAQTLETGESVEVVEITEVTGNGSEPPLPIRRRRARRAGPTQTTTITTVYLGADNLPRRIDRYRTTQTQGQFDRDAPPNTLLVARFQGASVDQEINREAFVLPTLRKTAGQ